MSSSPTTPLVKITSTKRNMFATSHNKLTGIIITLFIHLSTNAVPMICQITEVLHVFETKTLTYH